MKFSEPGIKIAAEWQNGLKQAILTSINWNLSGTCQYWATQIINGSQNLLESCTRFNGDICVVNRVSFVEDWLVIAIDTITCLVILCFINFRPNILPHDILVRDNIKQCALS